MAQVAVEKIDGKKAAPAPVLDDLKALSDRVRQRAFELFQRRGGVDGFALDDWFTAEQDVLQIPQAELIEKNGAFKVRLSAPGFEAGDLNVIAQPDALIVKAAAHHEHETNEENVHFCEFDQKTFYRRFNLPEAIAVDKVTASLENGVLRLLAPKVKPEETKAEPGGVEVKTRAGAS